MYQLHVAIDFMVKKDDADFAAHTGFDLNDNVSAMQPSEIRKACRLSVN